MGKMGAGWAQKRIGGEGGGKLHECVFPQNLEKTKGF